MSQTIEWIPVTWHTITEDERKQENYPKEWITHIDCLLPTDDEEILVTIKRVSQVTGQTNYFVIQDICMIDDGYYLDSGYSWIDDVVAWMPMPKPYLPNETTGGK